MINTVQNGFSCHISSSVLFYYYVSAGRKTIRKKQLKFFEKARIYFDAGNWKDCEITI